MVTVLRILALVCLILFLAALAFYAFVLGYEVYADSQFRKDLKKRKEK